MSTQAHTALKIELRTAKNAVSLLTQEIPVEQMEPGVKAYFEKKQAQVAALEKRLKSA